MWCPWLLMSRQSALNNLIMWPRPSIRAYQCIIANSYSHQSLAITIRSLNNSRFRLKARTRPIAIFSQCWSRWTHWIQVNWCIACQPKRLNIREKHPWQRTLWKSTLNEIVGKKNLLWFGHYLRDFSFFCTFSCSLSLRSASTCSLCFCSVLMKFISRFWAALNLRSSSSSLSPTPGIVIALPRPPSDSSVFYVLCCWAAFE